MGINTKNKVEESVKENKEKVKIDKDKDKSKRVNDRESKNDFKPKVKENYKEYNKEKRENKWDKINWKKDISEKKGSSKWNKIDWNKNISENVNEINKIKNPNDRVKVNKDYEYRNLSDSKVKDTLISYYNETGKYANYGMSLQKNFIDWIKKSGRNHDMISKISEIQKNKEIPNFIRDKIENSVLSQKSITNLLNKNGLSVSRKTVGNFSLKEVFNNNKEKHLQRFTHAINTETKKNIKKRLGEELAKYKKGDQHDSLYKISKEFPEISKISINKIAKKEISQQLYEKMWPSTSGVVTNGTRQAIKTRLKEEAVKENPDSLRSISKDFPKASNTTVMDLARELYPDKHKELWPAIKKIPDEIKNDILKTIKEETLKENPKSLRNIHKEFPQVGADTIKRLAKQCIPKALHDKLWPPLTPEIPKSLTRKIIQTIRDEIYKIEPRSLNKIGQQFNVSATYIWKLAKKEISKKDYDATWNISITNEKRLNVIKDIENSKLNISEIAQKNRISSPSVSIISQREVFQNNIEAHRERFPKDVNLDIGNYTHLNLNSLITKAFDNIPNQKYYAEPTIYSDKRRPDGLILEDNKFLSQRLNDHNVGKYLRNKIELDPLSLDHIKATQFDFTNDISNGNLINKIEKYQSKDSLLVIIGTKWHLYDEIKHLPIDNRIKYPQNVRVISNNLGTDLLGLEGKDKDLFERIIDLNLDRDLDSLKVLYNYDLSSLDIHTTEELKSDLIQKKLIKEDFSEYFNKGDSENRNKKQRELGYFLNL
ncbi:hypothetical protein LCGC14_0415110 [marine sediment metagenome]|uniref:Uncharacterized protein n=1 Tax=marine sediment metagenome TaxID=412755 RepID=A0A0F9SYK9_9ZZZZ|nr:hypothetical protein [archaeon]